MRRALCWMTTVAALTPLSSLASIAGCAADAPSSSDERGAPVLGRVEQANIVDGNADGIFGQSDYSTGSPPAVVSNMTLRYPAGIAFDRYSLNGLWIADQEANRVLRVPSPLSSPVGDDAGPPRLPDSLLGQLDFDHDLPNRGLPTPNNNSVISPSAIASGSSTTGLRAFAIADPGNNRVLAAQFPGAPNAVFGQHGSFTTQNSNDGGISRGSLAEPSGVAFDSNLRLFIADTANHRVLVFNPYLTATPDTEAYLVIGQPDFASNRPNRGASSPSSDSLRGPSGIATYNPSVGTDPLRGFYVADSANHRVLHFRVGPATADLVYGQLGSFTTATPSKGGVSASSLRNPTAVAVDLGGGLFIADTGHHRVLHFKKGSTVADHVYGQATFTTGSAPTVITPHTLSAPTGVAVAPNGDLYVADTGSSRVLRFSYVCTSAVDGGCDDGDPCTDDSCVPGGFSPGCLHVFPSAPNVPRACAPYACDYGTHLCRTSCNPALGIQCEPGYSCSGTNRCVRPCGGGLGCASGFCVDGYCCDAPCNEPCGACNLPLREGKCSVVVGHPVGARSCGSGSDADCENECNGADKTSCTAAPKGRACGVEGCKEGVQSTRGKCDGAGRCASEARVCAPYGCAPNGCRTRCDGDYECAQDALCVQGVCVASSAREASGGGCELGATPPSMHTFLAELGVLSALAATRIRRARRTRRKR